MTATACLLVEGQQCCSVVHSVVHTAVQAQTAKGSSVSSAEIHLCCWLVHAVASHRLSAVHSVSDNSCSMQAYNFS